MLITSTEGLVDWLAAAGPAAPLAIDTEFIGERTFRPRLCLIQVAVADRVAAIDPLSNVNLEPLNDVLRNPEITKIVHAGQQDARILHDRFGDRPRGIIDTQIVAAFLGYGESIGLGRLVEQVAGVVLDKGESLTDWAQRPLTDAQVEYALNDVRYLGTIYTTLMEGLDARGRRAWLAEEHAVYRSDAFYEPDPNEAYLRVKGAAKLRGREIAALRALAAWRERVAGEIDRPRNRVASNDILIALSRRMPRSMSDLRRMRGISPGFAEQFGRAVLTELDRVRSMAPEAYPPPIAGREPADGDSRLVDLLEIVLKSRAEDVSISPGIVATRKGLFALVDAHREGRRTGTPILEGWRSKLLGEELLNVLTGAVSVTVDAATGRVKVVDSARDGQS